LVWLITGSNSTAGSDYQNQKHSEATLVWLIWQYAPCLWFLRFNRFLAFFRWVGFLLS
jgi:hypothetical protein